MGRKLVENWQKHKRELEEEHEVVCVQMGVEQSASDRLRLRREAESLEQAILKLEKKIRDALVQQEQLPQLLSTLKHTRPHGQWADVPSDYHNSQAFSVSHLDSKKMPDDKTQSIQIKEKIKGQNIIISSNQIIHGDMRITAGQPNVVNNKLQRLQTQTNQLLQLLVHIPSEYTESVAKIMLAAEDILVDLGDVQLNKEKLCIRADNLEEAIELMGGEFSDVSQMASKIVKGIRKSDLWIV